MNYQDFAAREAQAHYMRQVRYEQFKRIMLNIVWPCIAMAAVLILVWK